MLSSAGGPKVESDLQLRSVTSSRPRELRFKSEYSLKRSDFTRLTQYRSKTFNFKSFRVKTYSNGLEHLRLGLSIRKNFGSAPQRNRMKRIIREFLRENQNNYKGLDMIFQIRTNHLNVPIKIENLKNDLSKLALSPGK